MIVNTLAHAYELINERQHAAVAARVAGHVLTTWHVSPVVQSHMAEPVGLDVITSGPVARPAGIQGATLATRAAPVGAEDDLIGSLVDDSRMIGRRIALEHWRRAQSAAAQVEQDAELIDIAMRWCDCLSFVLCRRMGMDGEPVAFARGPDHMPYTARMIGGDTYTVSPWPFDVPVLTLDAIGWRLPRSLPDDEATLVAALPQAAVVSVSWTLVRPT